MSERRGLVRLSLLVKVGAFLGGKRRYPLQQRLPRARIRGSIRDSCALPEHIGLDDSHEVRMDVDTGVAGLAVELVLHRVATHLIAHDLALRIDLSAPLLRDPPVALYSQCPLDIGDSGLKLRHMTLRFRSFRARVG